MSEGALEELLRAALRGPSAPTARATVAGAVAALRTAAPTVGPDAAGDAAEVLSALLAEVDGAGPAGDAVAAPPTRAARPPVSPASASSPVFTRRTGSYHQPRSSCSQNAGQREAKCSG